MKIIDDQFHGTKDGWVYAHYAMDGPAHWAEIENYLNNKLNGLAQARYARHEFINGDPSGDMVFYFNRIDGDIMNYMFGKKSF